MVPQPCGGVPEGDALWLWPVVAVPAVAVDVDSLPRCTGSDSCGGMVGGLLAGALTAGFNRAGAVVVTLALLVTATFLTTTFSFGRAHAWASGPKGPIGAMDKLGILQRVQARWRDWRERREQERMRRRVETNRLEGRKPIKSQAASAALLEEEPKTIHLNDESDIFDGKDPGKTA